MSAALLSSSNEAAVEQNRHVDWCVGNMIVGSKVFRGISMVTLLGNIGSPSLKQAVGTVLIVGVVVGLCQTSCVGTLIDVVISGLLFLGRLGRAFRRNICEDTHGFGLSPNGMMLRSDVHVVEDPMKLGELMMNEDICRCWWC